MYIFVWRIFCKILLACICLNNFLALHTLCSLRGQRYLTKLIFFVNIIFFPYVNFKKYFSKGIDFLFNFILGSNLRFQKSFLLL